jgi:hypothetical protein
MLTALLGTKENSPRQVSSSAVQLRSSALGTLGLDRELEARVQQEDSHARHHHIGLECSNTWDRA